jgi:hypothetical protein
VVPLKKDRPAFAGAVTQSAFGVRTLLILGGSCLLLALALSFWMLPQSFRPLPRDGFQSQVLESSASREGVEIIKSQGEFDGRSVVVVEWKEAAR